MKFRLKFFITLILFSLGFSLKAENSQQSTNAYKVLTHAEAFDRFWVNAQKLSLEEKLKLYEKSPFENKFKEFYNDLAFNSKVDPDWLMSKRKTLENLFDQDGKSHDAISKKNEIMLERVPTLTKDTIDFFSYDRPIEVVITPIFTAVRRAQTFQTVTNEYSPTP